MSGKETKKLLKLYEELYGLEPVKKNRRVKKHKKRTSAAKKSAKK